MLACQRIDSAASNPCKNLRQGAHTVCALHLHTYSQKPNNTRDDAQALLLLQLGFNVVQRQHKKAKDVEVQETWDMYLEQQCFTFGTQKGSITSGP
jgi:hypothetical protein